MIKKLRPLWKQTSHAERTITKLHQQTIEALQAVSKEHGVELKYKMSHLTSKYDLEVDLLLTHLDGRPLKTPIALEVDGPYHYPRNSQEATGTTVLKHKILRTREGLQLL